MTDEQFIAQQKFIENMSGRSSSEAPKRPIDLNNAIVNPQGTFIVSANMYQSLGTSPLGLDPESQVDPYSLFTNYTSVRNSAGVYTVTFSGTKLQSSNFKHSNNRIMGIVRSIELSNTVIINSNTAWIGGAGTYAIQVLITSWDVRLGTPGFGPGNYGASNLFLEIWER